MVNKNSCENCGKCAEKCPALIDIPKYIWAYQSSLSGEDIISIGKPIDCIECGYCTLRCPQKINVLEIIRESAMCDCVKYSMEAVL